MNILALHSCQILCCPSPPLRRVPAAVDIDSRRRISEEPVVTNNGGRTDRAVDVPRPRRAQEEAEIRRLARDAAASNGYHRADLIDELLPVGPEDGGSERARRN
jgi:hypothetical protein